MGPILETTLLSELAVRDPKTEPLCYAARERIAAMKKQTPYNLSLEVMDAMSAGNAGYVEKLTTALNEFHLPASEFQVELVARGARGKPDVVGVRIDWIVGEHVITVAFDWSVLTLTSAKQDVSAMFTAGIQTALRKLSDARFKGAA